MPSKYSYILRKLILFSAILSISIVTQHYFQGFVQRYISSTKLRRRDHDGIGIPLNKACFNVTNTFLSDTSELNKGGFAAGTTLMTLLPSLLTFAPMPTAKIRDSMYTSPWLALFTAGLTFGLPITQYSSVLDQRTFRPDEFFPHQNREAENGAPADGAEQFDNTTAERTALLTTVSELDAAAVRKKLFPLPNQRPLARLMVFIFTVGCVQWGLFLVLIMALPKIDGFTVVWVCVDVSLQLYLGWLAITYALSSMFLLYWNSSFRKAQIVLHCIPEQQKPFMLETRDSKNITHRLLRLLHVNLDIYGLSDRKLIRRAGWRSSFQHAHDIFRLPRPSIVVVRVTDDKTHQDVPLWVRHIAAAANAVMLLLLTLLFGSLWGLRLFHAFAFVLIFSLVVFLSRAISIWSSTLLQNSTNLTIIECDDEPTISEVERRLRSIPDILISNKTSGCSYLNNQCVGPKGPKAGGVIISCVVLAWLSGISVYAATTALLIYSFGINILNIFFMIYIWISVITVFRTELKHKAGFNIPERLLDEPVEVGSVELADLPPI